MFVLLIWDDKRCRVVCWQGGTRQLAWQERRGTPPDAPVLNDLP